MSLENVEKDTEEFHDSIQLVVDENPTNKILLKKWFYRWKGGVNFFTKRSVNDSDSNPSDSTSEDSSRTDNTISTPELVEMEHDGVVKYKKLSYHSVEKLINKYYLGMVITNPFVVSY